MSTVLADAQSRLAAVRQGLQMRVDLPAVPRVVQLLIEQLNGQDVSVRALVDLVEQEPLIAARALRLANSPFYGGRRSMASISDAVAVIGTDALRTLVISGGLESVFVKVPGVSLRDFWATSTLAAQWGRALARWVGAPPEPAFLAGLLHATGHLILCRGFEARLRPLLLGVRAPRMAQLAELERQACGFGHPEVGAWWLDSLNFPHEMINAVARHLDPGEFKGDPHAARLSLSASLACRIDSGQAAEAAWQDTLREPAASAAGLHPGQYAEFADLYGRLSGVGAAA